MNGWSMEAFDMLLEAWVTIVQDPMLAPQGLGLLENANAADTPGGLEMQVRLATFAMFIPM